MLPTAQAEGKEREKEMKTGLILEGGAMRGMFSAGVMDVMMENGIRFDGITMRNTAATSAIAASVLS